MVKVNEMIREPRMCFAVGVRLYVMRVMLAMNLEGNGMSGRGGKV